MPTLDLPAVQASLDARTLFVLGPSAPSRVEIQLLFSPWIDKQSTSPTLAGAECLTMSVPSLERRRV